MIWRIIASLFLILQGPAFPGPGSGPFVAGARAFSSPAANHFCYARITSGTAIACTLATAPAAGSFVTVSVSAWGPSGGASLTISDGTNSYTVLGPSNANFGSAGYAWMGYWAPTVTGGTTITATLTGGTCQFCSIGVDNWGVSGGVGSVALQSGTSVTGSGTGTAINTPTIVPSPIGSLLVCYAATLHGGITATGSPWTADPNGIGSVGDETEYILSSSGSQACNFTQNTGDWDSIGASFL